MSIDPKTLAAHPDRVAILENIEKASTRMVCQAVLDFSEIAKKQFTLAKDLAGTVGEDVTRDAMDSMGMSRIPTARLIGTIDYKRAAYCFDPSYSIRQALLVDSKAEKGGVGNMTIQIAQTSLHVRMELRGNIIDVPGQVEQVLAVDDGSYLATTIFVKYGYEVQGNGDNKLNEIYVVALPNGMLQDLYNPSAADGIWMVGRNAPTLINEDLRVRVSFAKLKAKKKWRVQRIAIDPAIRFAWED
ncbi:MAG: SfiI family type II restriction endonuclease [Gemmataceae bacterium]|nr:SfiI family type II restriction endonuclease [Gemmataceae bacterium]